MTESHHIGFQSLVGGRAVGTKTDVAVVFQIVINAAHAKHILGIGGRDDGHPAFVVAFVSGGVAHQNAFFDGFVCGFGDVGGAVHVAGPVAFFAVAKRTINNVGTVLVGPFSPLCPPHLFLERFGVDFSAGQQELRTRGEAEFLSFLVETCNATQYHRAVCAPAIDVFLFVWEVVGLQDLVVVAQMFESGMGVHIRETAVHHADAQALAIDALVNEMLAAETLQLVGENVDLFIAVIASAAKQSIIIRSGLLRRASSQ